MRVGNEARQAGQQQRHAVRRPAVCAGVTAETGLWMCQTILLQSVCTYELAVAARCCHVICRPQQLVVV